MEIIFITIPVTILFIAIAAAIFFWASKGGQYDDLDSPAHRILFDDDITPPTKQNADKTEDKEKQDSQQPTTPADKQP